MAVETVVKTIGTTGRIFSTLQTWEDGAPANLTTAERWNAGTFSGPFTQGETVTGVGLTAGKFLDSDGSTYVTFGIVTGNSATLVTLTGSTSGATCVVSAKTFTGVIWQGQAYNDTEFTSASTLVFFSGSTTSTTCYKELTAAAGQSFQDQANVRTTALTYNAALGVALRATATYVDVVSVSDTNARVSRIQIKGSKGQLLIGKLGLFKDIVVYCSDLTATVPVSFNSTGGTTTLVNVLFIADSTATTVAWALTGGANVLVGCTAIRTSNRTAAGTGFSTSYSTSTQLISCASFGFTTCFSNVHGDTVTGSKNNATDQASGLPGTSNQHSVTYTGTTPFTQAAAASNDMRAIAATTLAANGFLDSTNAPNDISGFVRSATPTIGHWELAPTGGLGSRFGLIGVGN